MRLGVDFSQGAPLTATTIDCWKQQGVTFSIVQYSAMLPEYLAALKDQGIRLEAYVYLYFPRSPWNQTPEARVQACLAMIKGTAVKRVWLDVEDDGDTGTPAAIEGALLRCVWLVEAAGLQAGIYTRRNAYELRLGNSTAFAHLPLWHAGYTATGSPADLSQTPQAFSYFPYGGWAKPTIQQWHDTTMLCGHSVDLNVEEEDTLPNINTDGSQRFESAGNFVILYNGNVAIRMWGSTDGAHQGREALNLGGVWWWVRHFRDDGSFDPVGTLSETEGD